MRTTKPLLTLAIMLALPFGAHATDPVVAVGPAHASSNPVVATANAPYVTVTPSQADESHIATTAYVKGAYNDAIAAVNNVANTVDGKQAQLVNGYGNEIYSNVVNGLMGLGADLVTMETDDYASTKGDLAEAVTEGATRNLDNVLITAGTTMDMIREVGQELQEKLVYYNNGTEEEIDYRVAHSLNEIQAGHLVDGDVVYEAIDYTLNQLSNKRVEIYTTWNNDNAKQQVAFVNAPAQQ